MNFFLYESEKVTAIQVKLTIATDFLISPRIAFRKTIDYSISIQIRMA